MIAIDVPGLGPLAISRVLSDFSGTLAFEGALRPAVRDRLVQLAAKVEIHVLTADTFGTARRQLDGIPLTLSVLASDRHDEEKRDYALAREPRTVAAFGNGRNDRLLLKAVKEAGGLAVVVDNGEGYAVETMLNASIVVTGCENALDLLLDPSRCKATLRL